MTDEEKIAAQEAQFERLKREPVSLELIYRLLAEWAYAGRSRPSHILLSDAVFADARMRFPDEFVRTRKGAYTILGMKVCILPWRDDDAPGVQLLGGKDR